ncbi:putative peptidase M48 [Rosa chinensis]|uniref:Putative peptidase M48 n=1 Tax=Rosa chinensis TaxID=74649 RepID=A0A2P6SML7_ROSCH|nr:putative peptidase M48 [Rosa chinensis]
MLGEYTFEEMKKEKTRSRQHILSDRYLQTRRVRRIANEITQALMRGISREDKEKGGRWWRGSRVATSHLDGLLRHFKSDEEIATILGHEVGHAVARHAAETITNYTWLVIFFQFFSGAVAAHSFDKLSNLLFSLPLSKMEMEADYIGLLLLASAGYDPMVAPGVYQKFSKLAGETPNQKDYLSTHPTGKKRAEKLAQANVMKEALYIPGCTSSTWGP